MKRAMTKSRGIVKADSGLQKALADYVDARWPKDMLAPAALEAAVAALKASSPAAYDKSIVLREITMVDFLSHAKASAQFTPGAPLLICGENGLGKTNLIEAVLFALTGQVSKGLNMAGLVRQGASKAYVELLMGGERGEYRIRRTVSLNSKGAATHKVDVEIKGENDKWTSLADGGVAATQAALARLIGATFLSMRAVNFQFQRDANPFIGAEASERKAILAEILGLDAIGRAFKILNEDRLVKMRVKETAATVAEEAEANCDLDKLKDFKNNLKGYEAKKPAAEAAVKTAKATLEAAIASAGAVGSERNTLQGVIDSLEGQAHGGADLRKAKADAEAAFAKGREERGAVYLAAKKRAETKAAQAAQVPDMQVAYQNALKRLEEATAAVGKMNAAAMAEIDRLDGLSAQAAKIAVDARLSAKDAIRFVSEATGAMQNATTEVGRIEQEIRKLSNQDMKTCSKCGQPIDSSHIEAELATLQVDLTKAKDTLTKAIASLDYARDARAAAEAQEKTALAAAEAAAKEASKAKANAEAEAATAVAVAKQNATLAEMTLKTAQQAADDMKQAEAERDAAFKAGTEAKEAHDKAMTALNAQIADADKKAAEAKAKADEARKSLAGIDARLATAQGVVEAARQAEAKAQQNLDFIMTSIAGLKASIEKAQEYEDRAKARRKELASATIAWQIADMASQAMDPKAGLPVHLIDERLPALADAVNSYLTAFGTPEFTIGFSTRKEDGKETLDVLVDNGVEPRLDVHAYSGGQLDRIEFCLRMALGDLAEEMRDVRLGFAMMDEPGTHLDSDKKSALINMVIERAADGRCPVAVIVSHDPKLMSAIPNRLVVSRDGIKAV